MSVSQQRSGNPVRSVQQRLSSARSSVLSDSREASAQKRHGRADFLQLPPATRGCRNDRQYPATTREAPEKTRQ